MGIPALGNSGISVVFLAVDCYTFEVQDTVGLAEPDLRSGLFRVFFLSVNSHHQLRDEGLLRFREVFRMDWRELASSVLG